MSREEVRRGAAEASIQAVDGVSRSRMTYIVEGAHPAALKGEGSADACGVRGPISAVATVVEQLRP